MDDTQKMLRMIINGQSSFRQELLSKIDKLDTRLSERIDQVDKKLSGRMDSLEENLTRRIDSLGKTLAYLEDDAPTRWDFPITFTD